MAEEERLRKILAFNLSHYIALRGESLQRIADDIGISKSALSNYCNGYRYPRPAQLDALAEYLHVTVGDLTQEIQETQGTQGAHGAQGSGVHGGRYGQQAVWIRQMVEQLDDHGQEIVRAVIEVELKRMRSERLKKADTSEKTQF